MSEVIECPLMGVIEDSICFDISMVAEGLAPLRTAPNQATEITDFKKICLNCKNHRD